MKKTMIGMLLVAAVSVADANWHRGAVDSDGRSIDPHTLPEYQKQKIWQPDPVKGDVTAYNSKIVAYADKWTRHGFGSFGGTCGWRKSESRVSPNNYWDAFQITQDYDVDGDGDTKDDFIISIPFSEDEVFNILPWPYSHTFPESLSGTFYGGLSAYYANTDPAYLRNRFDGEMGINYDHNPPFFDTRAEDHPLNVLPNDKNPQSAVAGYWLFLWDKEDFMNTPKGATVSFNENSELASLVTRSYWLGWDDTRLIVKDSGKLYASDTNSLHMWDPEKATGRDGFAPYRGRLFRLNPSKVTWAEYKPDGELIRFDFANATFEKREFNNVEAVGWYIAKNRLTPGEQAHCKWYGFEASAVVNRPRQPSVNIAMQPVGSGSSAFYMSRTEIPYSFWKDVLDYGDAPHYITEGRFVYDKNGDMGSMRYGSERHKADEPVTFITWYDALAWCNNLSVYEGKTPVYYLDKEFTKPFKNQHIWTLATQPSNPKTNPEIEPVVEPKIYVKWEADGYRIPTADEWETACGTQKAAVSAAKSTQVVGSGVANEHGLYDMIGNVWEYVWTFGDVYDPGTAKTLTVMGGGMHTPADPRNFSASPYGDTPFDGSYNIGLRIVCRDAGARAPSAGGAAETAGFSAAANVPVWSIARGEKTAALKEAVPGSEPVLEMVQLPGGTLWRTDGTKKAKAGEVLINAFEMSKFPITFAKWKEVYDWAVANGYTFSMDGDMGSMYWYDFEHSPDEPVTQIMWYDMAAWCNALSEMEGKKPFYYTDETFTTVFRNSIELRPIKFDIEDFMLTKGLKTGHWSDPYIGGNDGSMPSIWLFEKWDVNGYRLPTPAEFEYAVHGDKKITYLWGNEPGLEDEYMWTLVNSGGRTHPVGLKKPNMWGLHDILGNVAVFMNGTTKPAYSKPRPEHLDLDNPKQSMFQPVWEKEGMWLRFISPLFSGYSSFVENGGALGTITAKSTIFGYYTLHDHYYPDLGFRVVRCEAGTHPEDGKEPLKDSTVIDFNPADFDPLEGQAYRSDIRRDGVHPTAGVKANPKVAWTFKTGGAIFSSPVTVDNTVYFGSADGAFYAVDAATGSLKWKVDVPGGSESSACVAGGNVYFGGNDGYIYSVNAKTGSVNWKKPAGNGNPVTSSPAVAYDTVFVLAPGLYGFDVKTGKKIFESRATGGGEGVSPSIDAERTSYPLAGTGFSPVISLKTAMEVHVHGATQIKNAAGITTAAIADGISYQTKAAYCNTGPALPSIGAISLAEARTIWAKDAEQWRSPREQGPTYSSPAVWKNLMIAGNDSGYIYAYDITQEGKEVWRTDLGAMVRSSPSVSAKDGIIAIATDDGTLYGLNAADGAVRWKISVDTRSANEKSDTTKKFLRSSPWPQDGAVYIGSQDGSLYKITGGE